MIADYLALPEMQFLSTHWPKLLAFYGLAFLFAYLWIWRSRK